MQDKKYYIVLDDFGRRVMLLPCHINAERSSDCFRIFAGKFSPLLCTKAAITGKKDGVKAKGRL